MDEAGTAAGCAKRTSDHRRRCACRHRRSTHPQW